MSSTTDFIGGLIKFIKTDAFTLAAPHLAKFFASVSADSSTVNVMNQLVLLEASLLADLPTLEHDVIKQIGAFVTSQLTPAPAPAA